MSGLTDVTFRSIEPEQQVCLSTNSDNPDERKEARQKRIEARLIKLAAKETEGVGEPATFSRKGPVEVQRYKSNVKLEKAIKECIYDLNCYNVSNKNAEVARIKIRNEERKKVIEKVQQESKKAGKLFDDITIKWEKLFKFKDPVTTFEGIERIKAVCDEAIKKRDEIIIKLKEAVIDMERAFGINQKKNQEDMEGLDKKVGKHISQMREAFQLQFDIVVNTIECVKNSYLDAKNANYFRLNTNFDFNLKQLCNDKFAFLTKIENAVDKSKKDYEDKIRETRDLLLLNVQISHQQLEDIKAAVSLNYETLDYCLQILFRRADESIIFKSHQGRKINKLRDDRLQLRRTLRDFKNEKNLEIESFLKAINKLQTSIVDIDNKSAHFSTRNDKLFHDMYQLNKKVCWDLLKKIMNIDRILHEQQMGIAWKAPLDAPFEINTLPSYKNGLKLIEQMTIRPHFQAINKINPPKEELQKQLLERSDSAKDLQNSITYTKLIKTILIQLSDKTGFLTEKRINQITKNHEDEDIFLVKIDHLFQSLHIHEEQDIDLLLTYFLPYSFCLTCEKYQDVSYSSNTSDISFISSGVVASQRSTSHDPNEKLTLLDCLQHTTHTRESIDIAVCSILASPSMLQLYYKPSLESVDIAKLDMEKMKKEPGKRVKKKDTSSINAKMACQYNHKLVISHVYLLKAFADFIVAYYQRSKIIPTTGERMHKRKYTVSRLIDENEIERYWKQWKQLYSIDSNQYKLWCILSNGIGYYLKVLKQRKDAFNEVLLLRKKNNRLKTLLRSYETNHSFLPPLCTVKCICPTIQMPIHNLPRKMR